MFKAKEQGFYSLNKGNFVIIRPKKKIGMNNELIDYAVTNHLSMKDPP